MGKDLDYMEWDIFTNIQYILKTTGENRFPSLLNKFMCFHSQNFINDLIVQITTSRNSKAFLLGIWGFTKYITIKVITSFCPFWQRYEMPKEERRKPFILRNYEGDQEDNYFKEKDAMHIAQHSWRRVDGDISRREMANEQIFARQNGEWKRNLAIVFWSSRTPSSLFWDHPK